MITFSIKYYYYLLKSVTNTWRILVYFNNNNNNNNNNESLIRVMYEIFLEKIIYIYLLKLTITWKE